MQLIQTYYFQLFVQNMVTFWQHQSYVIGPGGRLNKKDSLTRYGDSHIKDKTS